MFLREDNKDYERISVNSNVNDSIEKVFSIGEVCLWMFSHASALDKLLFIYK